MPLENGVYAKPYPGEWSDNSLQTVRQQLCSLGRAALLVRQLPRLSALNSRIYHIA